MPQPEPRTTATADYRLSLNSANSARQLAPTAPISCPPEKYHTPSVLTPLAAIRSQKSRTVTWWMFCVSYQLSGKARDRHPATKQQRGTGAPVRKVGKADKGLAPHPQKLVEHQVGPLRSLQRLRQDGIVERLVGVIAKDRKSTRLK